MSTDIESKMEFHTLTQYWGGNEKGVCLQVRFKVWLVQIVPDSPRPALWGLLSHFTIADTLMTKGRRLPSLSDPY